MKTCKVCLEEKEESLFYNADNTCKECRKTKVRENRARKAEYYREYDRQRFKNDPKVKARHEKYQSTPQGKLAVKRAKKKYIEHNPIKRAAHVILGNSVRDGKIIKPGLCETCGSTGRIHGHHDDYAKPLEVRWLCASCHRQWHIENGEALNP